MSGDQDKTNGNRSSERDRLRGLFHRWNVQGEHEALGELLQSEMGLVKAYLRGRGLGENGSRSDVSDVAGEAVVRLLARAEQDKDLTFANHQALRSYLLTTAWRLCLQRFRDAGRTPIRTAGSMARDPSTTGGLGQVDRNDLNTACLLALNELPDPDRRVLQLSFLEGQDAETIAAACGLPSASAVRMRRVRALQKLSSRLRRWWELTE